MSQTTRENTKKGNARQRKKGAKRAWSTRGWREGKRACQLSLLVCTPYSIWGFSDRIKITRKLRRTVNVSGEARLLAIIWLSVHMGNFCAVDRSIKYREQNQSEDINFHYRSRLSCSFADSCNFTIKANSSTFEEVIHTRHKLCHYAGLTTAHWLVNYLS